MKSLRAARWVWLLPLFAGFLLRAPPAAAQLPPPSPQTQLAADVRSRLAEAASDSTLAPWKREFMLQAASEGMEGAANQPSPAPPNQDGSAPEAGFWIAIPPPSGRFALAAIYDPLRDRMVVFGGYDGTQYLYRNDMWALSLAGSPVWTEIIPAGTSPPVRLGHSAIYDAVRDRMVIFGGQDAGYRNDVWALSLAGTPAWSQLNPVGTSPSARYGHTAIYDPVRDRMVIFGGHDGAARNDVWALTLSADPAWSEVSPAGASPSGRYLHTGIYESVHDRMVVFGGYGVPLPTDVWALSLAGSPAWSSLAPAGTPPPGRYWHSAIYDPVRDRMVIFGGNTGNPLFNDVWTLSMAASPAWNQLAPAGAPPSPRYGHTAIYDPLRDRMVVFGGDPYGSPSNDLPTLSLAGGTGWSAIIPATGIPPDARQGHTAIYDPVRERMVAFGGSYRNDVWALSLAGSPAWSELAPAGTPPSARGGHTAVYDPVRDRMVVFGGNDGGLRNDVWALSLAGSPAWSELAPIGTPPSPRYGHTAIYDPVRDRMVVFGGNDPGGYCNDVWTLSLAGTSAWTALGPAGTPPSGREEHTSMYDPLRDRVVVFGGNDGGLRYDVFALSLAGSPAWSQLAPVGTPPFSRYGHTTIYDPVRDRMVVFAGSTGSHRNDVWALSLAGTPAWTLLVPTGSLPPGRSEHTAIYDPVRDRMVVYGGLNWMTRGELWALVWEGPVSVPGDPDAAFRAFELAGPRPNPSRGETTVDFTLGAPTHVVLDVFDARGRRVKRIADEWFTVGRHASTWRGDDDRGQAAGSGVYFIRMQGDGLRATRRTLRLR